MERNATLVKLPKFLQDLDLKQNFKLNKSSTNVSTLLRPILLYPNKLMCRRKLGVHGTHVTTSKVCLSPLLREPLCGSTSLHAHAC